MSESTGQTPEQTDDPDDEARRREMGEVQEKLDAESDEEGLGAEAGRGEEMGISEG